LKPGDRHRRLAWLATVALLGLELQLLVPLLHTLLQMLRVALTWPHLVADSAVFLDQPSLATGLEGWRALFLPVNEHRLVLSRLVAVGPLLLHQPLGSWSVAVSLLLISGCILAFDRCLGQLCNGRWNGDRLVVLLAGALLLLNPWQGENLIWDINLFWFFQNLLVLGSVALLLRLPPRVPLWFDLFLPPLALLNGGQGYAVLLAVGGVRLGLFRRRWLLPAATLVALAMGRLLPSGQAQVHVLGFNPIFLLRLLNGWWPMAGLGLILWGALLGIGLWVQRQSLGPCHWRQLCISAIPMVYGLGFGLSADLSRSPLGLAMAARESYVTPLLLLGLGGLLLGWQFSCARGTAVWSRGQVASLLLPVFISSPLLEAGFQRARFFPQQRLVLAEQDRRITWFHCRSLEGGRRFSHCPLTPVYDRWDLIRRSLVVQAGYWQVNNRLMVGPITGLEAQGWLQKQGRTDLRRLYLVRGNESQGHWVVGRKDVVPQPGDQLVQLIPGARSSWWRVLP
jgi:hypothetical protein